MERGRNDGGSHPGAPPVARSRSTRSQRAVPPSVLYALATAFALVLTLACVTTWRAASVGTGRHRVEPVSGAGHLVGAVTCLECHADFADHHVTSPVHPDCESCHGAGELHIHTAKASAIRFPDSSDCAACHDRASRTLLHWRSSPHSQAGVLCSDCHDTHDTEPDLLRPPDELDVVLWRQAGESTRLCVGCHGAVASELGLPSHHPVQEGMIACTDCHSPHGSLDEGTGPPTASCIGCHQEVAGPWIYEHPPVSEDCGYCHRPHGSTAEALMDANQPAACISCHTLAETGAVHEPWAFTTGCTDCHGAVHGSYTDPHLRR